MYVDKTSYIYKLLKDEGGQFFCARPRRFGKSLTVSAIEAIFRGRRELFDGLYIAGTDYDWPVHPVIHIDFGRYDNSTVELMESGLRRELRYTAEEYGISASSNKRSQAST